MISIYIHCWKINSKSKKIVIIPTQVALILTQSTGKIRPVFEKNLQIHFANKRTLNTPTYYWWSTNLVTLYSVTFHTKGQGLWLRKVPHLMERYFHFLTCCSCRISSLRASTRFWSSRLSWDNKSVPNSAFNDSLVDSIACKLASRLCKLRCCGTDIRQNHSSKQSIDLY